MATSATVGITDHAQKELGDIVYVDLPNRATPSRRQDHGSVESVKAVSDIYSPVSGEVTEVNECWPNTPETVNKDPHEERLDGQDPAVESATR